MAEYSGGWESFSKFIHSEIGLGNRVQFWHDS